MSHLSKTMKAVIADTLGPPENYSIQDIPLPELAKNQARVRIIAAGIGYADALIAAGKYQVVPPTPFIPGSEFAGMVESVGSGVSGISIGDRVCGSHMGGGLAEFIDVNASELSQLPDHVSYEAGATFLVNFQTSLYALKNRGKLQSGETLLVLGAAGGVGSAAVQIGKVMGAKVIAGASTEEKRQFALKAGADEVLDYTIDDWRKHLKMLTDGRGIDMVYDPVGGNLLEPAFRSLAWGGRHLVIGFTGGPIPALPVNLPLLKGASLVGVDIFQFSNKEPEVAAKNTRMLWDWIGEGRLQPPVGSLFSLSDFSAALKTALQGRSLGKIVVKVAEL